MMAASRASLLLRREPGGARRKAHSVCAISPVSIRLRPKPVLRMVKPASCRPRRTNRRSKGGQRPAGPRQARHGAEQILSPHVGIFRRGKAVKKPGVHPLVQRIIQLLVSSLISPNHRSSVTRPAVEQQTMAPVEGRRPLRLQLLRPRSQLWPALVRQAEILSLQRIFFKTDEM